MGFSLFNQLGLVVSSISANRQRILQSLHHAVSHLPHNSTINIFQMWYHSRPRKTLQVHKFNHRSRKKRGGLKPPFKDTVEEVWYTPSFQTSEKTLYLFRLNRISKLALITVPNICLKFHQIASEDP